MLMTGSAPIDAERAFTRARRPALARLLRRCAQDRLAVFDERAAGGAAAFRARLREIPIEAICATLEPSRSRLFDACFRPAAAARSRWERVWLAEHRGAVLPPISVVKVGEGYAVRDGHHRGSVARARGALTIDAIVEG